MKLATKIKKSTLESICSAARNVYPNEFIALLGSSKRNGTIDELVVLPATFGEDFSSIRFDLLPFDSSIAGSVHSHPDSDARPSSADLQVFKETGETHLIIAHPFSFSSTRAFGANGKALKIEVVE